MNSLPEADTPLQVKLWLGAEKDWLKRNVHRKAKVCKTGKKKKVKSLFHADWLL